MMPDGFKVVYGIHRKLCMVAVIPFYYAHFVMSSVSYVDGNTLKTIISTLEDFGYNVTYRIYSANGTHPTISS